MKVCHVTIHHQRLDNRIFYKECFALRDAGHEVYLIAPDGPAEREVIDGITVLRGPRMRGRTKYREACRQVFDLARTLGADLYHLHDPWLLSFGFKAKKLLGAKVIYDVHEDFPALCWGREWVPRPLRAVMAFFVERDEKRAARFFDAIVTVCESTRQRVEAVGGLAVPVRNYAPRGKSPTAPATREQYAGRGKVILHTGALDVERGRDLMLDAARQMKAWGTDFQLWLVASSVGDAAPGRQAAQDFLLQHDLGDRVKLIPPVPYEQIGSLLRQAAVGLSILAPAPGFHEATPTKLFEYMSYTTPVVGFDLPGHRQAIADNDCGWLFSEWSGESLGRRLAEILPQTDLRYEKGVRGYHTFIEKYCWENEIRRLIDLYESLASQPAKS